MHPTARPRRAGARTRRAVAVLTGVLLVLIAVSACGGTTPNHSASRASQATLARQFLAFAGCMRTHGLPAFPDPRVSASGNQVQVRISPGGLDPNSPAFKAATRACHHLLPDGGSPGAGASAKDRAQGLRFAVCMRAHGVPNFPDPDHDGAFELPSALTPQSPAVVRAMNACHSVHPGSMRFNGPTT